MKRERTTPTFDPLDDRTVEDPYPFYATLRESDPLHRNALGAWMLTRYADVHEALRDPRLGNAPSRYAVIHQRNRGRHMAADVANNIIPFLDPPGHTRPRRLVARSFHAHLADVPLELDRIAREILDRHRDRGELDMVADFGTPFSVAVLCKVLGVPEEDHAQLVRWSGCFFYLFAAIPSEEVLNELNGALGEFREYMTRLVEERRRAPREDLISRLIAARDGTDRLSDVELADHAMLLFADGVENVDKAVASAIALLLDHPIQLKRVIAEPRLVARAADECLRYESPAQYIGRVAQEELSLHGGTIQPDDPVLLVLGSANRDAEQFAKPDRFDVGREPNPYLSFGRGGHSCVGALLVRAEVEAAIRAVLAGLPGLRRKESRLRWVPRMGHRWLESLPVVFEPAAR